jgi:hypothetical protein
MNFEKSKSPHTEYSENFGDNCEWSMGTTDDEHAESEHAEYDCNMSGWKEHMNTYGNETPPDEYVLAQEQVTMDEWSD